MTKEGTGKTSQAAAVGDYTRYVQFMYLAGIAIATWLLSKIIETTWSTFGEPVSMAVIGASILAAVVSAVVLWRNKRVNQLAYEVVTELSKVTWPTKKELYAAVVAVIIVSIIVSIILFLFDTFWSWFTTLIYSL
ncbi:MAG: preprotein translocase subunit SecE [Pseudomonadota bacterium]